MKITSIYPSVGLISYNGLHRTNMPKNDQQKKQQPSKSKTTAYPINYYVSAKNRHNNPVAEFRKEFDKLIKEDKKEDKPFVQSIKPEFVDKIEHKLTKKPKNGIVIGITGKSASGKSTLTEKLIESANKKGVEVTLISGDQYFKKFSHLIKSHGSYENLIASGYEFDAPDNFRLALLKKHLHKLSEGKTIKTPQYTSDGECPCNKNEKKPAKLIIIEGLVAHYPVVKSAVDAKVFIDIDEKEREKRFVERAPKRHPDWTHEQIMKQYYSTTKAGDKYVAPLKDDADMIVNSDATMDTIDRFIDKLTTSISKLDKSSAQNIS